jgi:hypothetical protein
MAQFIKIPDNEMAFVREESIVASRSIEEQAAHWIRIGRAMELSGRFNYQHVKDALKGLMSTDDLSAEEQEIYLEEFSDSMWENSPDQEAEFTKHLGNGPLVDV